MPRIGYPDRFEREYRKRLEALLAPFGLLIQYELDRAALDLGLHLYEGPAPGRDAEVGTVRVWFQVKGLEESRLPASTFEASAEVAIGDLPVNTVRYWYALPEPVYLAVYIQAVDGFIAEDVRDIVDRQGGMAMLAKLANAGQKSITLKIRSDATLDRALERMPRHRSLRLDGPNFRGRPLGHGYDPLRSELAPLDPPVFQAMVRALLEAHDFRPAGDIALDDVLENPVGDVSAVLGKLYLTYEWISPLFTEFGYDTDSDFRLEASPEHAHGDVLVVIHSDPVGPARPAAAARTFVEQLQERGVGRALVFFNASELSEAKLFGGWRITLDPLASIPQGLGSLAFNVLTTTTVYLQFLDQLQWRHVHYL